MFRKNLLLLTFLISMFSFASAATFDKAIWIPYWGKTGGASSTLPNLSSITQISPFSFELQTDGTLKNALKIEEAPWPDLIAQAKKKGIKIYPSILSYPHNDKEKQIQYLLLAQKAKRIAHEKAIVALVKKYKFDGIDIDYEAKIAETKPYFSAFLTELGKLLHASNKKLICTVEARTPPESRYATTSTQVLSKVEYANDYKVIGKVCDQVRIMTYDQLNDDASLVQDNSAYLYRPVSDITWVKKVLTLALEDIPAKKILVGVATYGYKYEIISGTATSTRYIRIGSMNFIYADQLAKSIGITPTRNTAGELSFNYATTTDYSGQSLGGWKQYMVWYSDAQAIADKIKIAKLYKLGGVAIFKIDGSQDENIWKVIK